MVRQRIQFIPRRLLVVLLLTAVTVCPASAGELRIDGVQRSYDLYVPSSHQASKPSPLVLVLHGRSSNGERMARITGFNDRAEAHGFIVAYPEGLDHAWNYVHGIPGYRPGPNDSEFLLAVASHVAHEHDVDDTRIYAAGLSNGGFMVQRLACYAPSRFAAFASVAAGGYGAMPRACKDYRPVNILYIHGTEDDRVPWQGVRTQGAGGNPQQVTLSLTDSLKFWSRRNGCGPQVKQQELVQQGNSPGTSIRRLTASDCEGDAEVGLYAVIGGGHNWPGSRGIIPPHVAGRVNMDIHASDVIWAFFRRHALAR